MHHLPHLEDRDRREKTNEKEDEEQEETDGAGVRCPVPLGGYVDAPGGGQEIAMETGDDDDEALQPHTDVDDDRNDPNQHNVQTDLSVPQRLRNRNIAQD